MSLTNPTAADAQSHQPQIFELDSVTGGLATVGGVPQLSATARGGADGSNKVMKMRLPASWICAGVPSGDSLL